MASWTEMKREMRARFVPKHYKHYLFDKLQNLKQGNKYVEEYYKAMEQAMIRDRVHEDEEQSITSREQAFDPRPKWALVPEFFAPGIRNTFSPGWCLQPGLKVRAPTATAPDRGGRDL